MPIRIVLAEDNYLVREGVRRLLDLGVAASESQSRVRATGQPRDASQQPCGRLLSDSDGTRLALLRQHAGGRLQRPGRLRHALRRSRLAAAGAPGMPAPGPSLNQSGMTRYRSARGKSGRLAQEEPPRGGRRRSTGRRRSGSRRRRRRGHRRRGDARLPRRAVGRGPTARPPTTIRSQREARPR